MMTGEDASFGNRKIRYDDEAYCVEAYGISSLSFDSTLLVGGATLCNSQSSDIHIALNVPAHSQKVYTHPASGHQGVQSLRIGHDLHIARQIQTDPDSTQTVPDPPSVDHRLRHRKSYHLQAASRQNFWDAKR